MRVIDALIKRGLTTSSGRIYKRLAQGVVRLDGKEIDNLNMEIPPGKHIIQIRKEGEWLIQIEARTRQGE